MSAIKSAAQRLPKPSRKTYRFRCHKCGRFIGQDGHIDIAWDDYYGAYEEGYSRCGRCIAKAESRGETT